MNNDYRILQAHRENQDSIIKELKESNNILGEFVVHLREEVDSLKAGVCRFHCRTAKENWCAGYREACGRGLHFANEAEMNYNEWKRQQTASDDSI